MPDLKQVHLTGPGFSGRGVRLRALTPAMRSEALADAGKGVAASAEGDAGSAKALVKLFEERKTLYALVRVVAQVTDSCAAGEILAAKWRPVTELGLRTLEEPGGLYQLFTTKDLDVLGEYLTRTYYASVAEADTILGGMVAVTVD